MRYRAMVLTLSHALPRYGTDSEPGVASLLTFEGKAVQRQPLYMQRQALYI